jgi:site-specific DNA-cytosine methylase
MILNYGSVCSGLEAATVAWHPLGWQPAWFAEIEKFQKEMGIVKTDSKENILKARTEINQKIQDKRNEIKDKKRHAYRTRKYFIYQYRQAHGIRQNHQESNGDYYYHNYNPSEADEGESNAHDSPQTRARMVQQLFEGEDSSSSSPKK